jgi:hypothetical protein
MKNKTIKTLSDAEMPLFAGVWTLSSSTQVTPNCGRGNGSTQNAYGKQVRKCRYSVRTQSNGFYTHREIRVAKESGGVGSDFRGATITVQAKSSDLRGYGMMTICMENRDGTKTSVLINASEARHLAQALNAAANSCNCNWRKSSLGI